MIVNYGKNKIASAIAVGTDLSDWRTVKFGTDGTATALTDTNLRSAISGAEATASVTRADNKLSFSAMWVNDTGSTQTVREFGLFDGSGGMVARVATGDGDFSAVELADGQGIYLDSYDLYVRDESEV